MCNSCNCSSLTTAILGVNAITLKAVEVDDDVQFVPHIGLSLTINHQVVDGAPGARRQIAMWNPPIIDDALGTRRSALSEAAAAAASGELADGAVFLLPYYMGLYHGFIVESEHDHQNTGNGAGPAGRE